MSQGSYLHSTDIGWLTGAFTPLWRGRFGPAAWGAFGSVVTRGLVLNPPPDCPLLVGLTPLTHAEKHLLTHPSSSFSDRPPLRIQLNSLPLTSVAVVAPSSCGLPETWSSQRLSSSVKEWMEAKAADRWSTTSGTNWALLNRIVHRKRATAVVGKSIWLHRWSAALGHGTSGKYPFQVIRLD